MLENPVTRLINSKAPVLADLKEWKPGDPYWTAPELVYNFTASELRMITSYTEHQIARALEAEQKLYDFQKAVNSAVDTLRPLATVVE